MSDHINLILEIRKTIATLANNESISATELSTTLNQPIALVRVALARMTDEGLLGSSLVLGKVYYFRAPNFHASHITPMFAGTPDWVVKTFDDRLVCWCPREFDARVIADALSRS